jgi:serine/threonine protein kinase
MSFHDKCPTAEDIERFLASGSDAGEASDGLEEAWEEHFTQCGRCREYLRSRLSLAEEFTSLGKIDWEQPSSDRLRDIQSLVQFLKNSFAQGCSTGSFAPAGKRPDGQSHHSGSEDRDSPDTTFRAGIAQTELRWLREHARGGIGQVHLVYDATLGREVAVKELQSRFSDEATLRQRFLQEAEVTSSLEHPGVVPVYVRGERENGRPYYAMRYVRGENLRDVCRRFHEGTPRDFQGLEFRKLLRRLIDVCNTIAFAHSRGILHRDLKPDNIMLGLFGETLVIDWGMAKRCSQSSEPEDLPWAQAGQMRNASETRAAECIGTPPYMSPEQASGDPGQIGFPCDIYGLGTNLFFILTGKAPVPGDDVTQVLERVRAGSIAWSEIKPNTPPALIAIARKALAMAPKDRYPSALALADDLERWAIDQPVSAHRDTLATRVRRWMTQHPARSGAMGAAVIVAMLTSLSGAWLLSWKNQSLVMTNQQLLQATDALRDLNADLDEAYRDSEKKKQEVIEEKQQSDAMFTFLKQNLFRPIDDMAPVSPSGQSPVNNPTLRALLDRVALDLAVDKIDATVSNKPLVQAEILALVGNRFQGTGKDHQIVLEFLRRALALFHQELGADHPKALEVEWQIARVSATQGQTREAATSMRRVLPLLEANVRSDSFDLNLESKRREFVALLHRLGRHDEAIERQRSALARFENKFGAANVAVLQRRADLADGLVMAERLPEALSVFDQTWTTAKGVTGSEYYIGVGVAKGYASALQKLRRFEEARTILEEAYQNYAESHGHGAADTAFAVDLGACYQPILEELRSSPNQDRKLLARATYCAGYRSLARLSTREASELLLESLALYRELSPNDWKTANLQSLAGDALLKQKKYAEAEPLLLGAYERLEELEGSMPEVERVCIWQCCQRIVQLFSAWNRPTELHHWSQELAKRRRPQSLGNTGGTF